MQNLQFFPSLSFSFQEQEVGIKKMVLKDLMKSFDPIQDQLLHQLFAEY